MTAEYNRHGIKFLYPQSWKLVDEQLDQIPRSVTVQADSGAFWSVDIHPFSVDPQDILSQSLEAMQSEYDEVEVVSESEVICGEEAVGLNLMFWCLDFVVHCQLRVVKHGHATFALTYQAEDRDFEELQAVFAAITTSLLTDRLVGAETS